MDLSSKRLRNTNMSYTLISYSGYCTLIFSLCSGTGEQPLLNMDLDHFSESFRSKYSVWSFMERRKATPARHSNANWLLNVQNIGVCFPRRQNINITNTSILFIRTEVFHWPWRNEGSTRMLYIFWESYAAWNLWRRLSRFNWNTSSKSSKKCYQFVWKSMFHVWKCIENWLRIWHALQDDLEWSLE